MADVFQVGRGVEAGFFFNDTATTEIYTLSLHDALPDLKDKPAEAKDKPADAKDKPADAKDKPADAKDKDKQIGRAHV